MQIKLVLYVVQLVLKCQVMVPSVGSTIPTRRWIPGERWSLGCEIVIPPFFAPQDQKSLTGWRHIGTTSQGSVPCCCPRVFRGSQHVLSVSEQVVLRLALLCVFWIQSCKALSRPGNPFVWFSGTTCQGSVPCCCPRVFRGSQHVLSVSEQVVLRLVLLCVFWIQSCKALSCPGNPFVWFSGTTCQGSVPCCCPRVFRGSQHVLSVSEQGGIILCVAMIEFVVSSKLILYIAGWSVLTIILYVCTLLPKVGLKSTSCLRQSDNNFMSCTIYDIIILYISYNNI